MTPENWRYLLLVRLSRLDWGAARDDAAPFLERENEADPIS